LPPSLGGWTVGVLVQTNFGGVLTINGAPVGQELGQYYLQGEIGKVDGSGAAGAAERADGSIMIVVATDAPVDARNLERLGRRALAGLARTGSAMTNGSGDFVIAFSTVPVSVLADRRPLANEAMSPLFEAAIEATEEAIYNSLFLATSVRGADRTVEALPIAATLDVLRRYGAVR
jgi:D-aminopeptidase